MKLFKSKTAPAWLFTVLIVMVFVLPLLFNPFAYDIFEFPKNLWVKTLTLIMLGALVLEYFRGNFKKIHISSTQGVWISTFICILVLSLIVSLRPEVSFFGGYVREGGVINMLLYVMIFVLGLQVFSHKEHRETFLVVTLYSGVIVAIYALLQQIGVDIFPASATDVFAGRSYSSLGNPTSLGAYLLFPMAAFMALRLGTKKRPRWWILLLLFAAIVVAQNRASILAVILSTGIYLLWLGRKRPVFFCMLLMGAIVSMIGFGAIYGSDMRSLMSRITTWSSTWEMIKDYPIFGIGPENFLYIFDIYAHPDFYLYEDYTQTLDRPHNEFLEWWIHYGLAGAIFYLTLLYTILKKFWTTKSPIDRFVALGLLALILSNVFSFSLVTHLVFVVLFLAFLFRTEETIKLDTKAHYRWGSVILIIPFILWMLVFNLSSFIQDRHLKQSYEYFELEAYEESIDELMAAHNKDFHYAQPYKDSYALSYSLVHATGSEELLEMSQYFVMKEAQVSDYALTSMLSLARWNIFIGEIEAAENIYKSLYEQGHRHPLLFEKWADLYFTQYEIEAAALIYDEFFQWMPGTWKISFHDSEASRIFWKNHPTFDEVIIQAAMSYELIGEEELANSLLIELE